MSTLARRDLKSSRVQSPSFRVARSPKSKFQGRRRRLNTRTHPLCFSALVLIASCSAAPEPPPPDEVGVVRVPIILEDGLPWVDAKVGGRPVRLLLDLGGFDAVALIPEELTGLSVTWTGRA